MDEQSIWKKELSFRRKERLESPKSDAEAARAEEARQSIWKKEITFSRRSDVDTPEAESPDQSEPVAKPDVVPATEPITELPVPAVPAPAAPAEQWDAPPAMPPAPVELPPAAEAPTIVLLAESVAATVANEPAPAPFWKREISLGRSKGKSKAEKPQKPTREKKPKAAKEQKAPKQPKAAKAPKTPKLPKLKLERGSGRGPKKLVGLKIGASQLAAAYVSNNGAAELVQVAREPLDPGVVVGGELRDPDALVEALKEFFRRNKLPKRGVRLGIANNRIGVRTFDVAGIDDQKQLANAIKFRAQEALPIPIDEAVLDYQILSEGVDTEGKQVRRVLLVVAYREQIDRYVEACKRAGLGLVGIDLEAFALLRALQAPQQGAGDDPTAALVAVTMGHDRSTFAVSDGRVCEFTRVLDWGGSTLNVVIARALDAAPSEVEGIKRHLSLANESVPEGMSAEQAEKARAAVRQAIQTFARELVSSLQYYQNQPGSLGIGEIILTGGTAHLPGLSGELERLI